LSVRRFSVRAAALMCEIYYHGLTCLQSFFIFISSSNSCRHLWCGRTTSWLQWCAPPHDVSGNSGFVILSANSM